MRSTAELSLNDELSASFRRSWTADLADLVKRPLFPTPHIMAPYNFDAQDTDIVLRSSDGKEFHVHSLVLRLASAVFQDMFNLPRPTEPPSQTPAIDISESSDILQPFLQYLYPRSPPTVSDLPMWEALYTIADKYIAEGVMKSLQDILLHKFLVVFPLRVYAIASRWGIAEVAKIASTRTLKIDIFKDLPREDAELMGGVACQQLYLLHFNRREAIRGVVANHLISSEHCGCSPPDYSLLVPVLSQNAVRTHWLTTEALHEASSLFQPKACGNECRNASKNAHSYFISILKEISKLPRTI